MKNSLLNMARSRYSFRARLDYWFREGSVGYGCLVVLVLIGMCLAFTAFETFVEWGVAKIGVVACFAIYFVYVCVKMRIQEKLEERKKKEVQNAKRD